MPQFGSELERYSVAFLARTHRFHIVMIPFTTATESSNTFYWKCFYVFWIYINFIFLQYLFWAQDLSRLRHWHKACKQIENICLAGMFFGEEKIENICCFFFLQFQFVYSIRFPFWGTMFHWSGLKRAERNGTPENGITVCFYDLYEYIEWNCFLSGTFRRRYSSYNLWNTTIP